MLYHSHQNIPPVSFCEPLSGHRKLRYLRPELASKSLLRKVWHSICSRLLSPMT